MKAGQFGLSLLGAAVGVCLASVALAQSGSTGGAIGNREKSLSGSSDEPHSVERAPAVRPRSEEAPRRRASRSESGGAGGVSRFNGTWTTVATGNCTTAGTFTGAVIDGVISGPGFRGTVSPSGATRTIGGGGGLSVVSTGQIAAGGRTARGRYVQSDGCSGSFTSFRN